MATKKPLNPDELAALNESLEHSKEARGIRGGLGRIKGGQQKAPWGAGFFGQVSAPKWVPAGDNPLYRRFTRGAVLGAGSVEERERKLWMAHVEAALVEAGGELSWQKLQAAVVRRRKDDFPKGVESGEDESLWPKMALAHIPDDHLSTKDSMVRLAKRAKTS
eukprot:TRINITY_DN9107_c6_g1_i1.p1 TRINITY_DN9107_c6_g1~~TRINITY_DN9107_c6_g1_i1.p1  ORF type:complete len:163 (+),score=40.98 TRINITY_DN9107_c6_g1_i1:99-587(+)